MIHLWGVLLGLVVAQADANRILSHIPIRHGWWLWTQRALLYSVPVLVLCWGPLVWMDLLVGGPVFAMTHRFHLNGVRRKPWDYISLSNGYDGFWLWLSPKGGRLAYVAEVVAIVVLWWLKSRSLSIPTEASLG